MFESRHGDQSANQRSVRAADYRVDDHHGQAFDPFWSLVEKGAQTAASQFNVNLEYQSPNTTDPQAQATMITQAAAKKPPPWW